MTNVVKPMLGKDAPADLSVLTYPVIVQPKLDGFRCLIVDGVARTRSFKPIENVEIQAYLGRPEFNGLDGEIVVGPPTAEDAFDRTTRYVRSRSKTGEPWAFHVFDIFGDQYDGGLDKSELPYYKRAAILKEDWFDLRVQDPQQRLALVDGVKAETPEAVTDRELQCLEAGYEGVMIRDPRDAYKHGRSGKKGPLLKVKRFIDFEARIVGCFEKMHNANEAKQDAFGRTERSSAKEGLVPTGTLGGFYLEAVNGPHEGQRFKVGTGFTAEQREELWQNYRPGMYGSSMHPTLKGQTVKIKSFLVGAKDAPRFPVFLGFRDLEVDG